MGRAKQNYLEEEDRGFSANRNLLVCQNHFQDKDILDYFFKSGEIEGTCAFCEDEFEEVLKISWFELLNIIVPCVRYFYDDPANALSYVSAEGGYIGNTYNTLELLQEIIRLEADFEIIQEIADSMSQGLWTEAEFYGESLSNHLIYNWKKFEELVKYKVRYVFNEVEDKGISDYSFRPFFILQDIGKFIKELDLISTVPEKDDLFNQEVIFYRARQHKNKDKVEKCADIGSAPNNIARANRFSAEGISIFYGAQDEETAIMEIINCTSTDEVVSIGEFMPVKELNLIDLRNITPIGVFNKEKLNLIEPSRFLMNFVKNISKKMTPEVNEKINYVPSQIVTEYFRFVLPKTLGKEVNGVVYKSIQNPEKDCYAIFADSTQCKDEGNSNSQTIIILKKGGIKQRKCS